MEKVPAEFLEDAIAELSEILDGLHAVTVAGTNSLSRQFSQKLFRGLHTIKGSSQTFGLEEEAKLAHLTETLLTDLQNAASEDRLALLKDSLAGLKENLTSIAEKRKPHSLQILVDRVANVLPAAVAMEDAGETPIGFPDEIRQKLSPSETQSLTSALSGGDEVLILQFAIPPSEFGERFKELKEVLGREKVIAVTPGQAVKNAVLVRFLLAVKESGELAAAVKKHSGRVLYQRRKEEGAFLDGNVEETSDPLIAYGEKAARMLGKNIQFKVVKDVREIPTEFSSLASLVFQHLLRNAVDHGIEFPLERHALGKPRRGTVELTITQTENELVLSVCDDGRGMESATEIFDSGYSTAPFVTEVSGRGIGLDVVRDAVQKAGGIIKVDSKPGHGARFEVDFPLLNAK